MKASLLEYPDTALCGVDQGGGCLAAPPWPAAAILLAGGQSSRMGHDKRFLLFNGRPLIQHVTENLRRCFEEVVIAANDPEHLSFLNVPVVLDPSPGQGPLAGITSALAATLHDLNFVMACDIPCINLRLAARLLEAAQDYEGAIPETLDGHLEPLFAVYRRSLLPRMEHAFTHGVRKVTEAFRGCALAYVPMEACEVPVNLNTTEDYEAFMASIHGMPCTEAIYTNAHPGYAACTPHAPSFSGFPPGIHPLP